MIYTAIIPFILHITTYWITSLIFFIIDISCLDLNHINWKKYPKAIKVSLYNQFFISLPTLCVLSRPLANSIESSINDSWYLILLKLFVIINLSNLLFYSFHRILHIHWFYKNIHYLHHEFIEPVAVATLYAHPVEHLFSNTLSFLIPLILIGTTYKITMGYLVLGTLSGILAHVDYKFIPFENEHLLHHKLYKYNYGFGGYLDKLFGTYLTKANNTINPSTINSYQS